MITKDLVHVALVENKKIDEIKEFRGFNAQTDAESFVKDFNSKYGEENVTFAKIMSYRDPVSNI